MANKKTAPKAALVLPDLHVPYHDRRSLKAVLDYASGRRWDYVVQLGDFMDHNCISRHNKENLRAVEGQTLRQDYEWGGEVLSQIETATPGAKRWIIEGNHDWRPEVIIDKEPKFKGTIETEICLKLKERGWGYVRWWSQGKTLTIGNAVYAHGRPTAGYHANKMASDYGVPIFYGHTHDVMCVSKVFHGKDKTVVGQSLGLLARYDMPWLRGTPTKWQQALGVFYFLPNGYFTYYVPQLFNHSFVSPDGEVFSG